MNRSRSYFEKRQEMQEAFKRYSQTPVNKRLKYTAIGVISIGILLMMAMIFSLDNISWETMLWMRGCVGLCAIIFFILVCVLTYRVHMAYWQERNKRK